MPSEKLKIKLIERRVHEYATALHGITHFEIIKLERGEFSMHRQAIRESCGRDAEAMHSWAYPVADEEVVKFLCERISVLNKIVYIPCEEPFIIMAKINNCSHFVKSLWQVTGTKDLTLYFVEPTEVIQLQDLEYEAAYFQIALPA
jgi:hypothetical protein